MRTFEQKSPLIGEICDVDRIGGLARQVLAGDEEHARLVYRALGAEIWMQTFVDRVPPQ